MRPYTLSALCASAGLAQAHSGFGSVPGNNYAIGAEDATFDYVVVGGGTARLAIA
jgi:hypothetical protein